MVLVVSVGFRPEGLCFWSRWLGCRLEVYLFGGIGWSVARRVMFLVVLVGRHMEGYVFSRVEWFAAWRVICF